MDEKFVLVNNIKQQHIITHQNNNTQYTHFTRFDVWLKRESAEAGAYLRLPFSSLFIVLTFLEKTSFKHLALNFSFWSKHHWSSSSLSIRMLQVCWKDN